MRQASWATGLLIGWAMAATGAARADLKKSEPQIGPYPQAVQGYQAPPAATPTFVAPATSYPAPAAPNTYPGYPTATAANQLPPPSTPPQEVLDAFEKSRRPTIAQAAPPITSYVAPPAVMATVTAPLAVEQLPINAKLRADLTRSVSVEFDNMRLKNAVGVLREMATVPILLDLGGLDDAGIDDSSTVTLRLQNVKLAAALDLILEPLELTWVERDEVILITSEDRAMGFLQTMVYPVADLVAADSPSAGEPLTKLIETIDADSWKESGGTGFAIYNPETRSLIITQNNSAHRRISSLLSRLREAKERSSRLTQVVPPPQILPAPRVALPVAGTGGTGIIDHSGEIRQLRKEVSELRALLRKK